MLAPEGMFKKSHGIVGPGETVQLSVNMKAPLASGRYITYYQLIGHTNKSEVKAKHKHSEETIRGAKVWCSVIVSEPVVQEPLV